MIIVGLQQGKATSGVDFSPPSPPVIITTNSPSSSYALNETAAAAVVHLYVLHPDPLAFSTGGSPARLPAASGPIRRRGGVASSRRAQRGGQGRGGRSGGRMTPSVRASRGVTCDKRVAGGASCVLKGGGRGGGGGGHYGRKPSEAALKTALKCVFVRVCVCAADSGRAGSH